MKIQHVSVACRQLQTAGKGNTVGQQSLGQFIVRNVMCPMVVVSFLYTWLILGVTFILPNTFLQLSSISLIYSSRLYENFLPFTFLYTIYLFFVTLRTAFDCFCVSFFKKRKKPKTPQQNPCNHQWMFYSCGHKLVPPFLSSHGHTPLPLTLCLLFRVSIAVLGLCFSVLIKPSMGKKNPHKEKAQKAVAVHILSTAD